jgi:hypothetical protein
MIAISVLSTKTCRARSIPQLAESLKRLAYKTASHFVSMIDGLKRLHERCGSPDFSKDTSGRRYLYDYMSLVSCLTGTNSTTLDIAVSATTWRPNFIPIYLRCMRSDRISCCCRRDRRNHPMGQGVSHVSQPELLSAFPCPSCTGYSLVRAGLSCV